MNAETAAKLVADTVFEDGDTQGLWPRVEELGGEAWKVEWLDGPEYVAALALLLPTGGSRYALWCEGQMYDTVSPD